VTVEKRIHKDSTDDFSVFATAQHLGLPFDPTDLPVYFAFSTGNTLPPSPTWKDGSWDVWADGTVVAKCLLTGGDLVPGEYHFWVKVEDGPRTPILPGQWEFEIVA
jgi:hypothetical protein